MSGSKTGGQKAAATNIKKYGEDYYRNIGRMGGSVTGVHKGFSKDDRSIIDRILRKPTWAQLAGAKGGSISKRGPAIKQRIINDMEVI